MKRRQFVTACAATAIAASYGGVAGAAKGLSTRGNSLILFKDASLFDGYDTVGIRNVLVAGNVVREVSESAINVSNAETINCDGKTLMPGMIDCHVHVYISGLGRQPRLGLPTYYAQYANKFLRYILDCGFTTVRDTAGGDHGLAHALRSGFLVGPRFFYGGYAISQTGGHGDLRTEDEATPLCACEHHNHSLIAVMADGVDECIKAVREELRKGAHHIKIMGSGGVMSPTDPVDRLQFSDAEIKAIVEETVRHGAYVTAHCHPDEAVLRCARLGVECIEHGTLTSKSTAQELAKLGTFVVPTLSVMGAIMHDGREMGISQVNLDKLNAIYGDAMSCLETMKEEGVNLAFGTDLLAAQHTRQGTEFTMRSEVFSPIEIMRQATSNSAELLRSKGDLGCVAPGAYADLLLVNGDPTKDIDLLASNGQDLSVILRDGKFVKQEA